MHELPYESILEQNARDERRPFWNYFDLLIVIGLGFASVLLIVAFLAIVARVVPSIKNDPLPLEIPLEFVLYGMIYFAFRLTFETRYGKPVFSSLGWKSVPFNPLLAIVGGVALAFGVSGLASLLHTPTIPSPFDKLTSSPSMLVLFAIFALVVGPLSEELVFRGFLQPLFSRTFGVAAGILITASIFGLLHGPEYAWAWQYVLAVSLAGVAFGIVRARTHSVIPSTLMHGCYNCVFIVALIVTKYAKLK